jgi:hypothetical protein
MNSSVIIDTQDIVGPHLQPESRPFPVYGKETMMMRQLCKLFAIVLCAAMMPILAAGHAPGTSGANPGCDEQDKYRDNDDQDGGWVQDPVVFTPRDRGTIRDYYRDIDLILSQELAKRGSNLRPDLQRRLKRNDTLPMGLLKRLEYLPGDLEERLPPLLTFYRRAIIGQDVVIIDNRTQRIIDVVHAIARLR